MQINQKISQIETELDNVDLNKNRKRYLESELNTLSTYHERHPEQIECPTDLEMFCDLNPDAIECRMFDL